METAERRRTSTCAAMNGQPGALGSLRGPARSQWWVPAGCALADDQDVCVRAPRVFVDTSLAADIEAASACVRRGPP